MLAVLVVFLITGAALPALPLHIHDSLGLGAAVVGLVSGAQFAASLLAGLLQLYVMDPDRHIIEVNTAT